MIIGTIFFLLVDEMIAEVDLDGDGRIDFEGNKNSQWTFLCDVNLLSIWLCIGHFLSQTNFYLD